MFMIAPKLKNQRILSNCMTSQLASNLIEFQGQRAKLCHPSRTRILFRGESSLRYRQQFSFVLKGFVRSPSFVDAKWPP